MKNRVFFRPTDPITDERIRETLALGAPEEPEPLPVPKPTPMELLQRWKIKAAAAHDKKRLPPEKPEAHWVQRSRYVTEEGWED